MTPLHAQATPNPEYLVPPPPVLSDPRAVFDRLVGIASLLRALDPSLPSHLRFYRRTEKAEDERNNVSFKLAFVADQSSNGMPTERDVDFWEAADKLLPAHALEGERKHLDEAPSYKFSSPVDAAVYGAHLEHVLTVGTTSTVDSDWVVQSSNALKVPEMDFMSEPSLSRWLYLAPNAKVDDDARISPALTRARAHVKVLMQCLSKPYDESTVADRSRAQESFAALEKGRSSFEATHQHGWIGYAFAHGSNGWTKPLLNMGADARAPYNGELPIVWATVCDAASDIRELENAGASVSLLLTNAPRVYDVESQGKLSSRMADFTSLVGLAAAAGASRAAATLCQLGANIQHADTRGVTPLHRAASDSNENLCRVLLLHGADLAKEDLDGCIAAERIPFGQDSFFQWMEAARLGKAAETIEVDIVPAPAAFLWSDTGMDTPVRSRRGPKR